MLRSFGSGYLWSGGYQMLRWLECSADLRPGSWLGRRLLDLGSGVGAVGLVALLLGAEAINAPLLELRLASAVPRRKGRPLRRRAACNASGEKRPGRRPKAVACTDGVVIGDVLISRKDTIDFFGAARVTMNKDASALFVHRFARWNTLRPRRLDGGRKAVMALYPAETRYPKTPWTTALLLMTVIALLSTRNVLVASRLSWLRLMAQKLGVSASILLAVQAGATFPSGLQFPSTLLVTMLLGRAVERTMGGPILFSTYAACLTVWAIFLAPIAACLAWKSALPGTSHAVSLFAFFLLFLATGRVVNVSSVQNAEPLPGCTSISLWLNRWRLFKSLVLGQFLIVLCASVPFWQLRGSLVLAALIAAFHWIAPQLRSQTDRLIAHVLDLRECVRRKLDDSLKHLASDTDENPPVACTVTLVLFLFVSQMIQQHGGMKLFQFVSNAPNIAWPQAILSTFLLPDWKTFSCSILLLLLFARPIELDLGPSALALLYVASGLATNLLCHWGMVRAPLGLAAMGSLWSLVVMGMMITLKDTVRLKRPGRTLRSFTALRHSAQRVDVARCLEAVVLLYVVISWAVHSFPSTLAVARSFRSRPPLLNISWMPGWLIAAAGGTAGLLSCTVMRKELPANREAVPSAPESFADVGYEGLACGYQPAPRHVNAAAHFSGTLLTLSTEWIPKPCATPLLLRWYGSYFPHIITAAVSPPPEWSPVPHVSCHGRHGRWHLCYAKVLRRHKGFSNYLFLQADVFMRPSRLSGYPLERPWMLGVGGYSPRSFGDSFVEENWKGQVKSKDKALIRKWWQSLAAPGLKKLYEAAAGGPKMPQASVAGVANVPAIMSRYFVTLAESMPDLRGELAQSLIFDLWDLIPGSPRPTWLIGENETFWTSGQPPKQRMYEDQSVAFTHPLWLSGLREQQMLDEYLSKHPEDF
eukprot:s283_g4.t1